MIHYIASLKDTSPRARVNACRNCSICMYVYRHVHYVCLYHLDKIGIFTDTVTHGRQKRTYRVIVIEIALQISAYLNPAPPGVEQDMLQGGGKGKILGKLR